MRKHLASPSLHPSFLQRFAHLLKRLRRCSSLRGNSQCKGESMSSSRDSTFLVQKVTSVTLLLFSDCLVLSQTLPRFYISACTFSSIFFEHILIASDCQMNDSDSTTDDMGSPSITPLLNPRNSPANWAVVLSTARSILYVMSQTQSRSGSNSLMSSPFSLCRGDWKEPVLITLHWPSLMPCCSHTHVIVE